MLEFHLDETSGIADLKPNGALQREDFQRLTDVVDKYIEKVGILQGLLIDARKFHGWSDFKAFRAHMSFIDDHHMRVARVAVVSDNTLLTLLPNIADFFLQAEVKHYTRYEDAKKWLLV